MAARSIWLDVVSPHRANALTVKCIQDVVQHPSAAYRIETLLEFLNFGTPMVQQALQSAIAKGIFDSFGMFLSLGVILDLEPGIVPKSAARARALLAIHLSDKDSPGQLVQLFVNGHTVSGILIVAASKFWRGNLKTPLLEALRLHVDGILATGARVGMKSMPCTTVKLLYIMWLHKIDRERIATMLIVQLATRTLTEQVVNLIAEILIVYKVPVLLPEAKRALESIPDSFRDTLDAVHS